MFPLNLNSSMFSTKVLHTKFFFWFFKIISEKSVSYYVNDLFNFEATDRLFSQRSNFFLQKQTKDVICL